MSLIITTKLEHILINPNEHGPRQIIKTKQVYIRKYTGNGKLVPLSESIVLGGAPNFLQVNEGKPALLDSLETAQTILYPCDTLETHNAIPYLFESKDGLNIYLKNAASYENLDSLFLKVKAILSLMLLLLCKCGLSSSCLLYAASGNTTIFLNILTVPGRKPHMLFGIISIIILSFDSYSFRI
jgi:hypothetical protein